MSLFKLALASLLSRKSNALLTIFAIAISVTLLLGVERVSQETRSGFANTISGTDLIVGARSGSVNLLLYSVFHIGNPTNNISWQTYQHWDQNRHIAWTVPIALGDSVRGFPVVGTDSRYFEHFRYGRQQPLVFDSGQPFNIGEAVIGAEVARRLNLNIGDDLVVAHGTGSVSFHEHDDHPLVISGVLERTGTPVDQAVYIHLRDLDMMHGGHAHDDDAHSHAHGHDHEHAGDSADAHHHSEHEHNGAHEEHNAEQQAAPPIPGISAFLVGLQSRPRAIFLQREFNTYRDEPLTAIMPGTTLQELWRTLSGFERALTVVSAFVLLTGLIGMLTTLLASLRERRREMAVLRSIGAGPRRIFALLISEAVALTLAGMVLGVALLYGLMLALAPWIQQAFGIVISIGGLTTAELVRLAIVLIAGFLISLIPAWRAYRNSLTDGLSMRV
ncbi:FtsX-like permease family protein [Aliidiomarina halalkaliphila]|uniref:FtsX-like permease family protein n=1 Tax=Aliidiomarina halalkaliphila TaxID=2593535 RepID=A0A552WZL3_9GAMM|nr:ABC transporter permease [Aliidiomarina halalkaliphila]TRW48184.1 FtsX-like permease family protein [Aliidiomarina halalkaliphila]